MEHTRRNSFYRFCCDGNNRSRATAQAGRSTGRAGGSRSPSGARTARGACTSPGGRAAHRRATGCPPDRRATGCPAHRRATGCPADRRAPHVRAARSAAAVCPALRRPAGLTHGATRADAASRGSRSSQRTGQPRWRDSCATEPAAKSGAARFGRRFRFGTAGARRPQRRATTKRGSATGCDAPESGKLRRSTVCSPCPCGQRPTRLLRRRAAQPGLSQLGYRARPTRAHARELDLPRPVLHSAVAAPLYAPDRDRLGRSAVLALRLLRLRRLHLLSLRV